jgi:hypothetical protein
MLQRGFAPLSWIGVVLRHQGRTVPNAGSWMRCSTGCR